MYTYTRLFLHTHFFLHDLELTLFKKNPRFPSYTNLFEFAHGFNKMFLKKKMHKNVVLFYKPNMNQI